jgi:phospholipid-binding lipoprotein MlaA
MGPSTLRDVFGRVPDRYTGYSRYVEHVPTRNVLTGVELINLRAELLSASRTLDEASLDKYQFLRDAFLQRRLNQVHDGKVPQAERDKLDESLEVPSPAAGKPAASPTPR